MNTAQQPNFDSSISDIRLKLIEHGYSPIPVEGKRPRLRGWQRHQATPASIRAWERGLPEQTNTGLLTGALVAIDVDVLDEGGVDTISALVRALPGGEHALCRVGRAPKCLFIFRTDEPSSKRLSRVFMFGEMKAQIEILGTGQQFVAFGEHPDTAMPYEWIGNSPLDVPFADLPAIGSAGLDQFITDAEAALMAAGGIAKAAPQRQSKTGRGTSFWANVNTAALSDIGAWITEIFPMAKKESGTGAWRVSSADLGRKLEEDLSIHPDGIRDFGTEDTATPINLVVEYLNPPSLLAAALKLCEWLGVEPATLGYVDKSGMWSGAASSLVARYAVPEAANDNDPSAIEDEEAEFKSSASLDALTRPGGFIEELIDWIVSSAEHPSRELALSAAIPFVGSLIGRRFKGYRDARSNIYSIALAPSGYGKDHARQQIKRLISCEHLHQFTGPARLMSASGLRNALMEKPSMNCQIDEIGGPLREILDPRASDHKAMIKADLLDYFSAASTSFEGAAFAQTKAVRLENPNLCIYGTTTPEDFWRSVSSLNTTDGFLARLLLFSVKDVKPGTIKPERDVSDVPPHIRAGARQLALAGRSGNLQIPSLDNGASPYTANAVPIAEAAEAKRAAFKKEIEHHLKKADPASQAVLNRAVEHAVKLALIVAVATDSVRPEISERNMEWAINVAWRSTCALISDAKFNVSDSVREANFNKLLRLIRDAGPAGISIGQLGDRTRGMDRRGRLEILDDMIDAKRIHSDVITPPGGGRKSIRFFFGRASSS